VQAFQAPHGIMRGMSESGSEIELVAKPARE